MQHKCTADNNFVNESRNHSPPLLRKPSPLETYFKVGLVFVKVLGMAPFNEGRGGGAEMGEESNPQDYRDVISAPRQVF